LSNQPSQRIAIIGGGPIGVEAALYGAVAGFDVQLFERGEIADNVRRWGFVQVFTEWGRNRSPLAARLLCEQGEILPPGEEYSSGDELAAYVQKLSALSPLHNRIHTRTEAVSLTRERCLKSDFLDSDGLHGLAQRADFSFRLHLKNTQREWIERFEVVMDATGVYHAPNYMGSGGVPCLGERQLAMQIDYALPNVLGTDRHRFSGKHTLVVGSGHSAASTLLAIADLIEEDPNTRLTWIVRRNVPLHGAPYTLLENDTSTTRARLHKAANALIAHPNVTFLPRTVVQEIAQENDVFKVALDCNNERRIVCCDNIAAHTGFRADDALWRELQVAVHPATGAPLKLGVELNAHNARSGIGLSTGYAEQQVQDEEVKQQAKDRWSYLINDPTLLQTGEANFYVLGIKSYGRDAGFLMHNGFRQVRDVWKLISGNETLDLYGDELK
jgi:hypothetical protein